jgi:AmmeMemoRadiSam system protein A
LPGENKAKKEEALSDELSKEEQAALLKISRRILDSYITTGKVEPVKEKLQILDEKRGMFVTLRKGKEKELRGCIGYIFAEKPLREAIAELTISSATRDNRFPPVLARELKNITIEISLLSPLKKETNPENIIMGKHGVYVKRGFSGGIFLPQVADETGWDREEFLSNLCAHKALLPPNAWKDPKTEIYTFTVSHFEEKP